MTETLYLNRHADAVRKFRAFIDQSEDLDAAWDAQKQIGEIYFNKTEQYDQAIIHYRALLKQKDGAVEAAEFLYRIARSHFFLWQFDDAIAVYKEIIRRNARTPWAERAAFEIGSTIFTKLAHESNRATSAEGYQEAIDAFEKFIRVYPKSQFVPEARFGIASCLESMDKLDMAYQHFETLKTSYPSPNVIEIKLVRIKERKAQRSQ
jgi:TolA-binding protein